MKQTLIHLFVSAFAAVFLVAACEPKEEVFPEIEINPAEIVLTSDGGTASVVLSANCSWSMDVPSDSFLRIAPTTGNGNDVIEIVVPPTEDTEGRGLMFNINGYLEDKFTMTKLTVKQLGQPGSVVFRDVVIHNSGGVPVEQIPPEGGFVSYTVVANYEWFLTANREGLHSLWDHGWMEGWNQWESYTWFPANVSGEAFEYVLVLSCFDEFGGTTDTLRLVQPPLEGSISLVSITPSSDGKTIPAAGARMILKVKSNSDWMIRHDPDIYWPYDPNAEHLSPYGGGPVSEQLVTVPVPPFDDPEGRTIRFWLLLNNLTYETGAIEFVQRGN
jgi:hypothetical protein